MKSRTFLGSIIPLILLSLVVGWQDYTIANANLNTSQVSLSGVDDNFWQPSYLKRSLRAEHNATPTPTTTPKITPQVRPQVSSLGIILGAIVIVIIIIGGVVWSGFLRGSLKR
jgi:hypothetical protein